MNESIVKVWIIKSSDGRWLSGPFDTVEEAADWLVEFHRVEDKSK